MKGKHLAIQVADQVARFVSLHNGTVINSAETALSGNHDEKRDSVNAIIDATSFVKDEFEDITLAWSTKRSTLVPSNIFSESSPRAIFELCFGKHSTGDSIDYNRVAELMLVNVFEIPEWIKRLFVVKFPRIIIQHEGSHVLRQVMSQATFYTKATLVVHQGYFQMTIVHHNNLEFYSFFDYQSAEDVIYHLCFALQQKEMINNKGSIEISAGPGVNVSLIQEITDGLKRVKDLDQLELMQPNEFIPKSQLLCV